MSISEIEQMMSVTSVTEVAIRCTDGKTRTPSEILEYLLVEMPERRDETLVKRVTLASGDKCEIYFELSSGAMRYTNLTTGELDDFANYGQVTLHGIHHGNEEFWLPGHVIAWLNEYR